MSVNLSAPARGSAAMPEAGGATGCIALADGSLFWGHGFGAEGVTVGELCFNTAMTGYQEVMTDPSYAQQIVTFTFPHVGNTGVTPEDDETSDVAARGMVVRWPVTAPSSWRSAGHLSDWLEGRGQIGVSGVDTRRLTRVIRSHGMPHAAIAHARDGRIDTGGLVECARAFPGLEGADLATEVTRAQSSRWTETGWRWGEGFGELPTPRRRVVAIDYGAKRTILRCLADVGAEVVVLPATATAEEVLAQQPDGVFLSNGPGDPAATGRYAVPTIRALLAADLPIFGICLGHQLLGLALGASTVKMSHGHHGVNHPVKELATGLVQITSMNHGFAIDAATLPSGVTETHVSLFDRSNCGLAVEGRPVFSVQYHPEASPGPQDARHLFDNFSKAMADRNR